MGYISDEKLIEARDDWTDSEWSSHFSGLGVKAAQRCRYHPGRSNDVLKKFLLKTQKGRCWFQGSRGCTSRELLARDTQIDHVVPRTASPSELREALESSVFQKEVFDVHDPGNLAAICGPCNQEKSSWSFADAPPALMLRRQRIEGMRNRVIAGYERWFREAELDDGVLKLMEGVRLQDSMTREIYADTIAAMIENLARQLGVTETLKGFQEVVAETASFNLSVRPSDEALEYQVEMMAELRADDERHGI